MKWLNTLAALIGVMILTSSARAGVIGEQNFKLTASDAVYGDFLGGAVALDGNVAIVSNHFDDYFVGTQNLYDAGSAYLFNTSTGQELFKLTASDAAEDQHFGRSVAINGNMAIVGSPGGNFTFGTVPGAAYLFDVTTGQQLFKLTASDAAAGDHFGYSVGVSGNLAIVGAWGDTHSGKGGAGSAYLFDVTTGQQLTKLTATGAAEGDAFGWSVAISGNNAIIGAFSQHDSAYLFDVSTGQQRLKLTPSDPAGLDTGFGGAVAINGNVAVVGSAYTWDGTNIDNTGSAYAFNVSTGQELYKLTASDADPNAVFGASVVISGNRALIGASGAPCIGRNPGAAYLFDLSTGEELTRIATRDFSSFPPTNFGSVGMSGDTIVVGAAQAQDSNNQQTGAAYVFSVVPETVQTDPRFKSLGGVSGCRYCIQSAAVDVSGDGSVAVGVGANGAGNSLEAFRWTQAGGMVGLGSLPGQSGSYAWAVSSDGNVVVGQSDGPTGAFRWTQAEGMVSLGRLPGKDFSYAHGVSADGSVIVGASYQPGYRAFRWTQATGMVDLGSLDDDAIASGVSADGSVVVGQTDIPGGGTEAFRWTQLGGMIGLGVGFGSATDVSADGKVVVGFGSIGSQSQAVRWSQETGATGLGNLPGGDSSHARGTSADGSIVVGGDYAYDELGNDVSRAFIWDAAHGMRSLQDVLINEYGFGQILAGWKLRSASAISLDGLTIVGHGINPYGQQEAWIAHLVPAIAGDFNRDGRVDAGDYVAWRKGLGTIYTASDYNVWRANFGATAGSGSVSGAVSIPEPATMLMLIANALAIAMFVRRRSNR